jgi:hypothetical protein
VGKESNREEGGSEPGDLAADPALVADGHEHEEELRAEHPAPPSTRMSEEGWLSTINRQQTANNHDWNCTRGSQFDAKHYEFVTER